MGPSSTITIHLNVERCITWSKNRPYAHIRAKLRPHRSIFLIDQVLDHLPAVCPSENTVYKIRAGSVRCKDGHQLIEVFKYFRGPKNEVFNFLSFWSYKVLPGWDDSKYGLKIVIRQYLTSCLVHKWSKSGKFGYFASFWPFSTILWPQRGLNVIRFQFWDQIWNPLLKPHLLVHKMKENWKLYFLAPYSISKTSTNWRPSLTSQIELKLHIQCFGSIRWTFEALTPCTFQKRCFSIHPT